MRFELRDLGLTLFIISVCAITGFGQTSSGRQRETPLSKTIREKLIEMRIDEEKAEYQQLLERCEEAAKLSEEIHESYAVNKKMTSIDRKKLLQVEDLSKKIRKDLRTGKDKSTEKPPASIGAAVKFLQESTSMLFEEIKNNTRHSVSVAAIQSSNKILKLVKFLKIKKE